MSQNLLNRYYKKKLETWFMPDELDYKLAVDYYLDCGRIPEDKDELKALLNFLSYECDYSTGKICKNCGALKE